MKRQPIIIIDDTDSRRNIFFDFLKELVLKDETLSDIFEIYAYKQVNREEHIVSDLFIDAGLVTFIHASNDYLDNFLTQKAKDSFVICYSGAGVKSLNGKNSKHFPFDKQISTIDDIKNKWHLKEFLYAVKKEENNPFYKLIGFDPILEAKLILIKNLHIHLREKSKNNSIIIKEIEDKVGEYLPKDELSRYLPQWKAFKDKNLNSEKTFNIVSVDELSQELFKTANA